MKAEKSLDTDLQDLRIFGLSNVTSLCVNSACPRLVQAAQNGEHIVLYGLANWKKKKSRDWLKAGEAAIEHFHKTVGRIIVAGKPSARMYFGLAPDHGGGLVRKLIVLHAKVDAIILMPVMGRWVGAGAG
jgi:hypothetical protein